MGYYDRVRKKQQIKDVAEKAMNDPRFKKLLQETEDKAYNRAMDAFLLISCDYLNDNFGCKKNGIIKFVEFYVKHMNYAKEDPEYFPLLNESLIEDTGVNVLGNRLEESKKYEKKEE